MSGRKTEITNHVEGDQINRRFEYEKNENEKIEEISMTEEMKNV